MGVASRLGIRIRGWVRQAPPRNGHQDTVRTPLPVELDELGQNTGDAATLHNVSVLEPQQIATLLTVSHELASTLKAIRRKVWRHPLKIVPEYNLKCTMCGTATEKDVEICTGPGCFAPRSLMSPPPEEERHILEEWQRECNADGQRLEDLGGELDYDGNAYDHLIVLFRFAHTLDEGGVITQSVLSEIRRGDPRLVRLVRDEKGRRGRRWWVCLRCREQGPKYRPEDNARPCQKCRGATYEAWAVEYQAPEGGSPVAYYIRSEVADETLHYDGSSPISRLWDKAIGLLWMDKYVWMAYDPRRDKHSDKIVVVIGGQAESIQKWVKNEAEQRRRNPYHLSTLHLPIIGAGAEARPDAKVLDIGADEIKKQSTEVYERFLRAIWREYGVTPSGMGDLKDAGGLNNEGLQLRVEAGTVTHNQGKHSRWLTRLKEAAGVMAWRYEFEDALDEQEQIDAAALTQLLDVAQRASALGLSVRWVDNRPVIADGTIRQTVSTTPTTESDGDVRPVEQASRMPTSSRQVPRPVKRVFGGPSGAIAARDAIHDGVFAGLTTEESTRVKNEIIASLTQPQGWSVSSITQRIQPILEEAGIPNPSHRAETIARSETGGIISEWKLRVIQAQQETGAASSTDLYGVEGAEDFRRTKLSWWIAQQVGDAGRPLRDVLEIMDRGIRLAKAGAFAEGGMLAATEGEPIRLPRDFTRRGTLCHFNDRDIVVRRHRGDSQ